MNGGGGEHHLHLRERIYKNLESFPHGDAFKRRFDRIMIVAGTVAPLVLLPQVIQIHTLKDAGSFSLVTWVLVLCGNFLWVSYGIIHKEKTIYLANTVSGILNSSIIVGILLYG